MSYLNLTDEEIIKQYNVIKKQMNISFYSICVALLVIGTVVWAIGGHFLIGAIVASAFGLFAFMGHLFYFVADAAELEGLYRHVTGE